MARPITPREADDARGKHIPGNVIEAFNELIQRDWDGNSATVKQDDVIAKLNVDRGKIFAEGWLNVEPLFEEAGWTVLYDKPGIGDSYGAYFRFERKS